MGVCLLHKHFDLKPNERLVEHAEGVRSIVEPVTQPADEHIIPYLWKVEVGSECRLLPLEFMERNAVLASRLEVLKNNVAFLVEVATALAPVSSFLGLFVLHRDHILAVDGSSMEYTDEEKRRLVLAPLSDKKTAQEFLDGHPKESTQTVWTFSDRKGVDICHHCHHCTHTK